MQTLDVDDGYFPVPGFGRDEGGHECDPEAFGDGHADGLRVAEFEDSREILYAETVGGQCITNRRHCAGAILTIDELTPGQVNRL